MMKRRILNFLLVGLLLCSAAVLPIHADGKSVYLSDYLLENPDRIISYEGWKILTDSNGEAVPGLNTNCDGKPIKLKGSNYDKGIGTHSSEAGDSQLTINVEGLDYEYFTALVGMSDEIFEQEVERNSAGFIVSVDGVVCQSTELLKYDSDPVEISVQIKGAKELTLALDAGETRYSDIAIWANAKLSDDKAVDKTTAAAPTVTPPPIGENMTYLSDYLADFTKMIDYTGYPLLEKDGRYIPGIDTSYDGSQIRIAGTTYAKGVGMHSGDQSGETILEIDIKDSGYTLFTATIGMNDYEWAQEVERNTAIFIVEVDNKVLYESDIMYYDSVPQEISINIAGASKLTLCLDPNKTPYSDSALWANAMLIKDSAVTRAPVSTPTAAKATATPQAGVPSVKPSSEVLKVSSGFPTVWIIVIVCAAVVIAAGIAVIIIIRKKKK